MDNESVGYCGRIIREDVTLSWKLVGTLDDRSIRKITYDAAGLYALVKEGLPLYIGKAGGIKPRRRVGTIEWTKPEAMANRLAQHKKDGRFQFSGVQVWVMDIKKAIGMVWENDIERIENELIDWLRRENDRNIPCNSACEGTVERRFVVVPLRMAEAILPLITLKPGISPKTTR